MVEERLEKWMRRQAEPLLVEWSKDHNLARLRLREGFPPGKTPMAPLLLWIPLVDKSANPGGSDLQAVLGTHGVMVVDGGGVDGTASPSARGGKERAA